MDHVILQRELASSPDVELILFVKRVGAAAQITIEVHNIQEMRTLGTSVVQGSQSPNCDYSCQNSHDN